MGDMESESVAPDGGSVDAVASDEPIDPVKAAEADAWLAQFRADNAAKVMEHNYDAAQDSWAEAKAEFAKRDFELSQEQRLTENAAKLRADAAALDEQAQKDAARHDEYETRAEIDRHKAAASEALAADAHAAATAADKAAGRADAEGDELYAIHEQHSKEYGVMQEQAVAAQRIATDEARLQHPGDASPGDRSAE